jgi:amidase
MPLAPSFDTFGWFAKDIATYARVGEILLGEDSAALEKPRPLRLEALDSLPFGTAETDEYRRMAGIVASVLGEAETAAPLTQSPLDLYWVFRRLQAYEAWAIHGDWISAGERELGPGVKERFEFGRTLGCEVATDETKKRNALRAELAGLLGADGVLVMPTVPGAAPLSTAPFEQLQDYRERAQQLLSLSGLSGFPQITIPLGSVDDAPFGISLLGPAGADRALIRLAASILDARGSN